MRLLRFGEPGLERPGVLVTDQSAVDVGDEVGDFTRAWFASGGVGRLRQLMESSRDRLPIVSLDGVRLGPPVPWPHQLLCIGMNYVDHAVETGQKVPDEPVVFNKAPNSLAGPQDGVLLPPGGHKTDWEVELAVVIGTRARYLADPADARACVAGFTISNDLSERSFQLERGGQWVKGKSCETFNPLGPWLVTPDETGDVGDLGLRLWLNGELVQDGSTAKMVFGVDHLVWYLSQFMVLEPGDVINTGTPPGVGLGMTPPRFLDEGDVMELEIDGLGRQRQVVRRASV